MSYLKFSENLKNAMQLNGITQTDLAQQLGTTQQTVSRWLGGRNEPDFDMLLKICLALHETPNDLLGYSEIPPAIKNS